MAGTFDGADRPSEASYRAATSPLVTNWRAASSRQLHYARLRAMRRQLASHETDGRMSRRPASAIDLRAAVVLSKPSE
jgi:hypothetical protein